MIVATLAVLAVVFGVVACSLGAMGRAFRKDYKPHR